jgi:hypothetical protein
MADQVRPCSQITEHGSDKLLYHMRVGQVERGWVEILLSESVGEEIAWQWFDKNSIVCPGEVELGMLGDDRCTPSYQPSWIADICE